MKALLMILPLTLILCFMVSCQDKEAMAELEDFKAQAAIEEQNKEVVKRLFEELNKGIEGNDEVFAEFIGPGYTYQTPPNSPMPEDMREAWESFPLLFKAFPDSHWTIEDLIAKGDKVIIRSVQRGTHEAEWLGVPATGNKIEVGIISILRFENGKIVQVWEQYDQLGWMIQLGMEFKPKEVEK